MLQVLDQEGALTLKPHYPYGAQSSGLVILRSLRVNLSKVGPDRKCFKSPNWQKIELSPGRRKHPWANTCWPFYLQIEHIPDFISSVKAISATAVGLKDLELSRVQAQKASWKDFYFILCLWWQDPTMLERTPYNLSVYWVTRDNMRYSPKHNVIERSVLNALW